MDKRYLLSGVAIGAVMTALVQAQSASAGTLYMALLKGSNEPSPTVGSSATGTGFVIVNDTPNSATVTLTDNEATANPNNPVTLGHIHRGTATVASGPIVFTFPNPNSPVGPLAWAIATADAATLSAGGLYMDVHTSQNANGDIRGQLLRVRFAQSTTNDVRYSLASALDVSAGMNSDLDSVLEQMAPLSAATQATYLDEIAGRSIYVQSREGLETMDGFTSSLFNLTESGRLGPAPHLGLGLFATGGADFTNRKTNADETGAQVTRPFVLGGVALNLPGANTVGVGAGYAVGTEKFHDNLGQTKAKTVTVDGFASLSFGMTGLLADAVVGYGSSTYNTARNLPDLGRTALSNPGGTTTSAALKLSRPVKFSSDLTFAPYMRADYAKTSVDAYSETGAASLGLVVPKQNINNSDVEGGAMLALNSPEPWGVLSPRVELGWRHMLDNGKLDLTTRIAGSSVTFVTPLLAAKDAARVGASLAAQFGSGIVASVGYNGLIGASRTTTHALEARVMIPLGGIIK